MQDQRLGICGADRIDGRNRSAASQILDEVTSKIRVLGHRDLMASASVAESGSAANDRARPDRTPDPAGCQSPCARLSKRRRRRWCEELPRGSAGSSSSSPTSITVDMARASGGSNMAPAVSSHKGPKGMVQSDAGHIKVIMLPGEICRPHDKTLRFYGKSSDS